MAFDADKLGRMALAVDNQIVADSQAVAVDNQVAAVDSQAAAVDSQAAVEGNRAVAEDTEIAHKTAVDLDLKLRSEK